MRVKVLGSAAGGGFPQWNCRCSNCRRYREGTFAGPARTQAQIAVSADADSWHLLNASPDLRAQIEAEPALHPARGLRHSPIASVALTSAELDQALGLLLLREWHAFQVYATAAVRTALLDRNAMFHVLERAPGQVCWNDVAPCAPFELARSGIAAVAIPAAGDAVSALIVRHGAGTLAYVPSAPAVPDAWLEWLDASDLLFFDGTFWSGDELIRVQGGGRTAREIGHLPVGGPDGALARLACLERPRKFFIHVNNTNPMLDEDGPERREVRNAGWEVASDGMEFEI